MATRNRRNEWHQVNGKWTRSLGERGLRVRLFQKRRDGTFYRTVWIPDRGRDHASMMTKDRGEAKRLGRSLLAELLRQEELSLPGRLTLLNLGESIAEFLTTHGTAFHIENIIVLPVIGGRPARDRRHGGVGG